MAPLIQGVGDTLWAEGCLSDYQVLNGSVLIALDGTDTFSSDSGIHCPSCHVTHRSDGSASHPPIPEDQKGLLGKTRNMGGRISPPIPEDTDEGS